METINGHDIYKSMVRSTLAIEKEKNLLNKTNVFPVADGDTGTNLHATMRAIVNNTEPDDDVDVVLGHMAEGALTGARGNSGLIVAQFFNGWSDAVAGRSHLSTSEFIDTLCIASEKSAAAVDTPTEGTILTLIDRWTGYLSERKGTHRSFPALLSDSLEYAGEILENTKHQLQVLADHNVVDSGAMGFYHVIASMAQHFNGAEEPELDMEGPLEIPDVDHAHDELGDYRYCTEALVLNSGTTPDALRELLGDLGDSLIVAGGRKNLRIHLHTNAPEVLHSLLVEEGLTILETKVDDMQIQLLDQQVSDRRIALCTDSIADLPESLIEAHRIHVLPIHLTINDSTFLDKVTVKPHTFYDLAGKFKNQPQSGIPSIQRAENLFDDLFSVYDDVLFISVAAKLSGMNQMISRLADGYKGRLHVIDSRLNSGAQGLLVLRAAEMIADGRPIDEIVRTLTSTRERTKIYVGVDTLKYMVKGGRVPPTLGIVGKVLNLKPIVSLDDMGAGIAFGKAFSRSGVLKKIKSLLAEDLPVSHLCIVHGNAPERAQIWKEQIESEFNITVDYITDISSVVAANSGPGAVAIAYIKKEGSS